MNNNVKTGAMYNSEEVEHTLDDTFITEALREARNRELELLKEKLSELYSQFKTPLKIFDIGIGDGHVPLHLGEELLANIKTYIGIDNSSREIKQCEKNIHKAHLQNLIRIFEFDATHLADSSFRQKLPLPVHAVLCTYFTPGNFRPDIYS